MIELRADNLVEIILDPETRSQLIEKIAGEQGVYLPLTNAYMDIGQRCHASPDMIRKIILTLLDAYEDFDWPVQPFLFHPNVPDDALLLVYERNRCVMALAHRPGPRALLIRFAEERHIDEAIATLALDYFSHEDRNAFAGFLGQYKDNKYLRSVIQGSPRLSNELRDFAFAILDRH